MTRGMSTQLLGGMIPSAGRHAHIRSAKLVHKNSSASAAPRVRGLGWLSKCIAKGLAGIVPGPLA